MDLLQELIGQLLPDLRVEISYGIVISRAFCSWWILVRNYWHFFYSTGWHRKQVQLRDSHKIPSLVIWNQPVAHSMNVEHNLCNEKVLQEGALD